MLSGILSKLNTTIYCRIQGAITRQQAVPTSLYRNPALSLSSGHTVCRKPMATSPSKAVLGDVYVDDLVSSCGSGVDFTKPAGVYFKDRTLRGCLKASVHLRRPQVLYGALSFGCSSTFYSNCRNRNSGLLHGPWLKNFSDSSSCCSAGAAHDVSFEGSPPDEHLATSTISPDLYVIVIPFVLRFCFCRNLPFYIIQVRCH